jgi:hypothetical protein
VGTVGVECRFVPADEHVAVRADARSGTGMVSQHSVHVHQFTARWYPKIHPDGLHYVPGSD